jgi:hypothetical protein
MFYNPTRYRLEELSMKSSIRLFLILIGMVLITACGARPVSTPSAVVGVVPGSLQTIEAAAEDIIDFAPSGNWDKINKDVTDIESAWKTYEAQAEKEGASSEIEAAMDSALSELQTATASKDASATMQGSNHVSAAVVELFALYHPKIPADIGRLDVLERQVILDVAAQNYSAAQGNLAETKSVWEKVKPSVLEHNGKDVAAEFEAGLTAQEAALAAKDDATLTNQAKAALEIVDSLELLFG